VADDDRHAGQRNALSQHFRVFTHDLPFQGRIADFPGRRLSRAFLRVVIRRHGKIQDRADRLDAKPVPVRVNELD
jgi:hypothetical protein